MAMSDRLLAAWYAGHPALKLLQPLEWLYRRVVTAKRARFLAGEGDIYQPPVPLVVVGNITVGGTGKTPLILWMIEHCQRAGLRVGVVSRGYGAKPPQLPWRVDAAQSAAVAGDEPLLIVQRSGVPLMIDPDRSRAVKALLASEPLDLILSDDGLQHYRLARDLELVLIDAARGLGNKRCLPAGPLRAPFDAQAAAAFRRLVRHLRHRHDAQNIDLMGLSGFCRNCLADWIVEAGAPYDKAGARAVIHGMPFAEWKERFQTEATAEQLARMEASLKLKDH